MIILETTRERISELEDRQIETSQNQMQSDAKRNDNNNTQTK